LFEFLFVGIFNLTFKATFYILQYVLPLVQYVYFALMLIWFCFLVKWPWVLERCYIIKIIIININDDFPVPSIFFIDLFFPLLHVQMKLEKLEYRAKVHLFQ